MTITDYIDTIFQGNALNILKDLPSRIANMCVTSPPYFGLRDYKTPIVSWSEVTYSLLGFEVHVPAMECHLGLEGDPKYYIGHLVLIFRELRRVLKDDGTLWLNIGDSYAAAAAAKSRTAEQAARRSKLEGSKGTQISCSEQPNKITKGLKPKDLIGIPWMLAFALRDDGWFLRQDIIWAKENPMPESVTDRCTKSHEYFFILSKSRKYYYDHNAIKTPVKPVKPETVKRDERGIGNDHKHIDGAPGQTPHGIKRPRPNIHKNLLDNGQTNHTLHITRASGNKQRKDASERGCPENSASNQKGSVPWEGAFANKRSVWNVNTKAFKGAHFAVFPAELIQDAIKAGSARGGGNNRPFLRFWNHRRNSQNTRQTFHWVRAGQALYSPEHQEAEGKPAIVRYHQSCNS